MPIIKTQDEVVVDAEGLLAAVEANLNLLPNIEDHTAPLGKALSRIKSLRVVHKTLGADRQKVTQELKEAYQEARDLAIQLRAVVRAKIGLRSEKLVEFDVPPLRKRLRKLKPDPEPPVE